MLFSERLCFHFHGIIGDGQTEILKYYFILIGVYTNYSIYQFRRN